MGVHSPKENISKKNSSQVNSIERQNSVATAPPAADLKSSGAGLISDICDAEQAVTAQC